jgi:DNA polymerase elongation subunit (family B)
MSTVVFDIETAAVPWLDLDPGVRDWVTRGAEDGAEYRKKKDWRSLSPYASKVIAIGMLNPDSGLGKVWYESPGPPTDERSADGMFEMAGTTEAGMLTGFWKDLGRYQRAVTFNGRAFDGPFLAIRSAIHGIRPCRNLSGYRYRVDDHVDLLEVLTFFGAAMPRPSLHVVCEAFGIRSPKSAEIHGYKVGEYYRLGRIREIAEYCRRDVEATAELLRKVEPTLLPLFAGSHG